MLSCLSLSLFPLCLFWLTAGWMEDVDRRTEGRQGIVQASGIALSLSMSMSMLLAHALLLMMYLRM